MFYNVMSGFKLEFVLVYVELVNEFVVFDWWFVLVFVLI